MHNWKKALSRSLNWVDSDTTDHGGAAASIAIAGNHRNDNLHKQHQQQAVYLTAKAESSSLSYTVDTAAAVSSESKRGNICRNSFMNNKTNTMMFMGISCFFTGVFTTAAAAFLLYNSRRRT